MIPPKLIIFDIDGVLTNGKSMYNEHGVAVSKEFNYKDVSALRQFKSELNIDIALCTCSKEINIEWAYRKKLQLYYIPYKPGRSEKHNLLSQICGDYNCTSTDIGFVGDDIQDIELMKRVNSNFKWCPADAIYNLRMMCNVLPVKGGDGVAACLFAIIQNEISVQDFI